jgi:fatty-acyl-CoA synthase
MPHPPAVPSYASGTSDVPLLGDTIGDNFDRTVAALPERDALVDRATAGGGATGN